MEDSLPSPESPEGQVAYADLLLPEPDALGVSHTGSDNDGGCYNAGMLAFGPGGTRDLHGFYDGGDVVKTHTNCVSHQRRKSTDHMKKLQISEGVVYTLNSDLWLMQEFTGSEQVRAQHWLNH